MFQRLQAYLRASAAANYRAIAVPPFTAYLHPSDRFPHFNYAIPDVPVSSDADSRAALGEITTLFRRENRIPRFEFIGEYAPDLSDLLADSGYHEESRLPLLLCAPDTLRPPTAPNALAIVALSNDSPAHLMVAHSRIAQIAFEPDAVWDSEGEAKLPAQKAAAIARGNGLFVAMLRGEPVAVASYSTPIDHMTELAGIATLPDYRGRGIAGALTHAVTAHAFAQGVTLAMLSAGGADAGRVYERVGYAPRATAAAYRNEGR